MQIINPGIVSLESGAFAAAAQLKIFWIHQVLLEEDPPPKVLFLPPSLPDWLMLLLLHDA
jgi:hypothetical protein